MSTTLRVNLDTPERSFEYSVSLDPLWCSYYELLSTTDTPIMSPANSELMVGSTASQRKLKVREGAAEYLAIKIADLLVESMKGHDMHNGYRKY